MTAPEKDYDKLRQLSRAVEHSPASVIITDTEGRIEYVNPGFVANTGYTAAEVIGGNPRLLNSGKHPPEFYAQIWSTLLAGRNWRGEILNRRKSGELFWEQASISPVPDEQGGITHYIAVKDDISERKRAESQLLDSNTRLQQTNAQLERALAQAREFAIAADASNRAKSAFLANMSHELRTPLNAILGVAGALGRGTSREDMAKCSGLILESGNNLLGIIEEILDYSGLQAGKARLDVKPFGLREVVSHCLQVAGEMARPKGLDLSYGIGTNVPSSIDGDSRRIRQILLNLLSNAVKYTAQGRVHLGIAARLLPGGAWRLSFTVSDTGMGISTEEIARLFQPFSRIRTGLSARVGGTGLGLAISRSFAQMMGGDVVVRSRPGRGATFRCEITVGGTEGQATLLADLAPATPNGKKLLVVDGDRHCRRFLVSSALAGPPAGAAGMDPAGKRDSPGRRAVLRVLAADDIRTNREMLGMLLRNLGYGASLVDNGREALAAVQRQTFDLVLLDVRMPVMDGLTAARAIVQLFPRASERPRLVALTANALPGDREACLAAGMDDYLSKPVSAGDIEACIQRLFSGKPGASAPEPQPAVATVSAEAPWLDLKYLETVFPGLESGEDRALVDELQAVANDDYQRIRPRLSEACRTRNFPAFVECAHALKGCFASLGWAQSALFCGRAVALARKGVFSDWETWPDELDGYVARSAEALRSHLRPVK